MKNLFLLLAIGFSLTVFSQDVSGVYFQEEEDVQTMWMITDNYLSVSSYQGKQFISTYGGNLVVNKKGKTFLQYEYHSTQPQLVGTSEEFKLADGLQKAEPKVQKLDGLWKITHRKVKGEFKAIEHPEGRKTIKILKDGYFQWIALNTEKKEMYATGGGRCSFQENKYTEAIEFFSKNNGRVGATLTFFGEITDGDWHHWGKSSTNEDIYEVWQK